MAIFVAYSLDQFVLNEQVIVPILYFNGYLEFIQKLFVYS